MASSRRFRHRCRWVTGRLPLMWSAGAVGVGDGPLGSSDDWLKGKKDEVDCYNVNTVPTVDGGGARKLGLRSLPLDDRLSNAGERLFCSAIRHRPIFFPNTAIQYMCQLRPTSAPKWVIKNDEISMLVMDFQQLSAI
ncbi:hypothetical protein OSB04_005128 [Centaurea solstitialis]|uniref:Uncharacterized protein n=1 Tax=Centaurea solstitialis TaxID=347529 RepID=A0AA38TN05_9ASTR|nr:hypothetical protein OSB04_005128 [Centaurea solstitialis]